MIQKEGGSGEEGKRGTLEWAFTFLPFYPFTLLPLPLLPLPLLPLCFSQPYHSEHYQQHLP